VVVLTSEIERRLLTIARDALEARVRRTHGSPVPSDEASHIRRGAFVTIFWKGELRGCLGRIISDTPLPELIGLLAQEVADSDPRFDPVQERELPDISLEVSVLTPEREIASIDDIEIGRHGLIIEQGSRRGLLLPQVPTEHGWDRDTFVAQACLKAGLSSDAWQHGARMFVFEAQVFGEGSRHG
jgi:AmmeMemoRadiSam system protein A